MRALALSSSPVTQYNYIWLLQKIISEYKGDITSFPPKINTVLGVFVLRPFPSYPESSFLLFISSFWTMEILWYFSSLHHLRPPIICTRFRSSQKISEQFMFKNCNSIKHMPYNFLVTLYAMTSNHFHNANKTWLLPFPLVLSPTFGQLGRPLPKEHFSP